MKVSFTAEELEAVRLALVWTENNADCINGGLWPGEAEALCNSKRKIENAIAKLKRPFVCPEEGHQD